MKKIYNSLINKLFMRLSEAGNSLLFTLVLFIGCNLLLGNRSTAQTTDPYTASGTWVCPTGITSATVECWGAGGAGGGQNATSDGGGGGGGGAYSSKVITVVAGTSYTVTVGTGGTGVAGGTGNNGGDSWFIDAATITAKGGIGGSPSTGTPPAGALGGAAASGVGTTKYSGGQGEIGRNNATGQGGYGGSSAGTALDGFSGPQTWATVTYPTASTPAGGGHGGNAGAASANGSAPASGYGGGGGGAGEGTNMTGGNGANGYVTITYTCSAPGSQATTYTSSSITGNSMTVGWTRGNGSHVMVVARAGGAVNADPTNGTSYTANAAFGSGTQIGTGNYVVYKGTGTSINITSLTPSTTYYYAIYEFNDCNPFYNLTELTGNTATVACSAAPTTQATTFTSSSITGNSMTVGWTRGNGNKVLVVARSGSAVNADPTNGTTYTANAAFGSGTQIGTGNYVVYNGTGTSVAVSGLSQSATYYYAVYEFDDCNPNYNLTELTGNATTTSSPDQWPGINLGTLTTAGSPYTNIASGTTTGGTNDCGQSSADHFYKFTLSSAADVEFSLCNAATNFDTYLHLYSNGASCAASTEIAYNDDGAGCTANKSKFSSILSAGTYVVMIEGYAANTGTYQLDMTVKNMSYTSSTTTQAVTSSVSASQTNQQIIGIQIVTAQSSQPFALTLMDINMTGTTSTSDVSNIDIFYTGTSSTFSTANIFGNVAPAGGTISISGNQPLATGTNYFWVAYDISSSATLNNYLDAQCTQITMNGGVGNKVPTTTSPVGSRQILAENTTVTMSSGTNSYTLCNGTFYDNGGSGSNYSSNFTGTVTFYPSTPCNNIKIDFSAYNTESGYDSISIYNGNSTSAPVLLNKYSGSSIPTGDPFTSSASDGSLTVVFKSDGSMVYAGWTAAVSCVASGGANMAYSSSTTTQASTSKVYSSNPNQEIVRVDVVTTNACNPKSLTQLLINMTGTTSVTDVSNIDVYYTTSTAFATTNRFGGVAPATGTLTINGTQTLAQGNNYFWIVYDMASSPTANNYVDAQCTQITVGGTNYAPTTTNPSGNRQIGSQAPTFSTKLGSSGRAWGVVHDAADNSLVWVGVTDEAFQAGGGDMYIAKTTIEGELTWDKSLGGTGDDDAFKVTTSGDGGYVIVGHTNSASLIVGASYDMVVTKVNSSGTHQWTTVIGTAANEYSDYSSILRGSDGKYYVVGDDGSDVVIYRLSSSGTLELTKTLSSTDFAHSIIEASGGGFVIAGSYLNGGSRDFLVVKLSADLTSVNWSMKWGDAAGNTSEDLYKIIENSANDYTVFGSTYAQGSGSGDYYAMRFTNSGAGATVAWVTTLGTSNTQNLRDAVFADGGYILAGLNNDGSYSNAYLAKLNTAGERVWETEILNGGTNREYECVTAIPSGGYAVASLGSFELHRAGSDGSHCASSTGSSGIRTTPSTPSITTTAPSVSTPTPTSASKTPTIGTGGFTVTSCAAALPVTLISFTSVCSNNEANLEWITASEINNDYFTVYRSVDGVNWKEIGKVPGAGNSNQVRQYSFIDKSQDLGSESTDIYYRLKQTDYDGKFEYSPITFCNMDNSASFNIVDLKPNPATESASFTCLSEEDINLLEVFIYDHLGKLIERQSFNSPGAYSENLIKVSSLKNGIYHLIFKADEFEILTKKLVILRN